MTNAAELSTGDPDVLIVGAGPTGLALACDLARRGVGHRIVERLGMPSTASRAKAIQPRGLEVMDDLGAVGPVVATGVTELPLRLYDLDGSWTDQPPVTVPATVPSPYPRPVWIAEFDVERALRARFTALGGRIEFDTAVEGITPSDDHVRVDIAGPDGPGVILARWVVGADGGRSLTRRAADIPFEGDTADRELYLGDVRTDDLDDTVLHMWSSPEGWLALTPLPSTGLFQFQCSLPETDGEPERASLELYRRIVDERVGAGRVRLTSASWLSLYRANHRLARHYRVGRVMLAGDAAHAHTPAGGQGMNTGIQDSFNLGWKLAAVTRGADPDLLDSYEIERRPVAAAVIADSTRKSNRLHAGATGDAAVLADSMHGISDDLTSGLTVAYPDSPLTRDGGGHRAPYVTGLNGPDFAGTTFDLFRGPHWTLLAFTDDAETAELRALGDDEVHVHRIGQGSITDPHDAARTAFGVEPDTLVVVRPDGYVAMAAPLHDTATAAVYLAAALPTHAAS
jgi:2-polyprenyl-6-methoxyphenol hydroxylase-like FAD-dependent oxidoreductase